MSNINSFVCSCGHIMGDHESQEPHACGQCDCSQYHARLEYKSVYVIVALDGSDVQECVIVESTDVALMIRDALIKIWGGANVAFISRGIGDIPKNILSVIS